jgi:hypothetical protein
MGGTVVTVGSDALFAGVAVMVASKFCTVTDATQPPLDVVPLLHDEMTTAKQRTAITATTLRRRPVQGPSIRNNSPIAVATRV